LALKAVVKKPWNLLCFVCCCWIQTTHPFDLFSFSSLFSSCTDYVQVTSVLFILFFPFVFTGASVSRISTQGGSSNRNGNIQKQKY
jgi:hypothetical protein